MNSAPRTRVVFIPGIMGSVLVDTHLDGVWSRARKTCHDNLNYFLKTVVSVWGEGLVKHANPCDQPHNPAVIWGEYGMVHWFFSTDEWLERMLRGNGIDVSGGVSVSRAINRQGLARVAVKGNWVGSAIQVFASPFTDDLGDVEIDPYGPFLSGLAELERQRKIELLVFPYDWRLSNAFSATQLAESIRLKWWKGVDSRDFGSQVIRPEERITIVAHSMGGLLARYFIEASDANLPHFRKPSKVSLHGHRLTRRLITVGTPHLGAPEAYLSFIGELRSFDMESKLLRFLREQLYLPRLFDYAVETEVELLTRGLPIPLPPPPKVAEYSDPNAGIAIRKSQLLALSQHMSSLVEMFPAYEFVPGDTTGPDGTPRLIDLDGQSPHHYRYIDEKTSSGVPRRLLLHDSSNHPPWRMFVEFRRRLIPPECLDQWLMSKGVHYHFLGTRSHETVAGYNPKAEPSNLVRDNEGGDGVVPWKSATLYPWSDRNTHHMHWYLSKTGFLHQDLFKADDIQTICRDLIVPPVKYGRVRQETERVPVAGISDIGGLVKAIMRSAGSGTVSAFAVESRRVVVSVITIHFRERGSGVPFADFFLSKGLAVPVVEYAKKGGPWLASNWSISYQSSGQTIGERSIVGVAAVERRLMVNLEFGGVIFLPETPCQDYLEIVTWNLGESSSQGVTNDTHAEIQFTTWFSSKFFPWLIGVSQRRRPQIRSIEIVNRGTGAYSPCSQCQEDLRKVGANLKSIGLRHSFGKLSWSRVYGATTLHHTAGPTYESELKDTEACGWEVVPPSPRPSL